MTDLFHAVEKLEDSNLKILSELFECQVEDLHISRSVASLSISASYHRESVFSNVVDLTTAKAQLLLNQRHC